MSQADTKKIPHILTLAVLFFAVVATIGCGGAISSSHNQSNGDPLHLGVIPGPLGSPIPQTIEVGLGSEPNDRIVSLSLTINSLEATNSGSQNLELLTAPVTVEFTRSATVTAPIVVRDIYQDTYSALAFSSMTGQVVFYDSNGQLATQSLNLSGRTIALSPNLVLALTPEVLSVSLDLAQTFTVGTNFVTANPIVVTASNSVPVPPVAPAVGQPETGSISFLVGTVTAVDTGTQTISIQPTSGDALQLSYDNSTQFIDGDPAILTNMMIETECETQINGAVLATRVAEFGFSTSNSELYGFLSGLAPDNMNYDLIVAGGTGENMTTDLIGKNVTIDWLAASYSVNHGRIPASLSLFNENTPGNLVFDETRTFPGQFVAVQWDTLIVPDPDSSNAGYMQPGMIELQEQTLSGQVTNYVYDPDTQTGTFDLSVAGDAPIKILNSGLLSITVHQIPQTYLRNTPTFADGDEVKVHGLLFLDPNYNNGDYHPPASVTFIMVADRISK